jgi:hypothetical protein
MYDAAPFSLNGYDLQGNLRGEGLVQYRKLLENPTAYDFYLGNHE